MSFTAKDVMKLREQTGVGMMDCKKALTESDGDMEQAVEILRKKGMATSAKRADKVASQGIVSSYISGKVGVLLEVNCESDFVARGDQFKEFVNAIAAYIADNDVADVDQVVKDNETLLHETVAKIGEKISIRRFTKYACDGDHKVDSYIHMGGKIGVMVEASANASDELLHDVALQIAAANPTYVDSSEVPEAEIAHEKEILMAQALNEPKPKPVNIIEKIIMGRIEKYYKEVCLIEQPFVKDGNIAVKALLKKDNVTITKFTRYTMGEGLEKKEEDHAAEVEAQINKAKGN